MTKGKQIMFIRTSRLNRHFLTRNGAQSYGFDSEFHIIDGDAGRHGY